MGCKSSRLLAGDVEQGDNPRKRSRANLKLDLIQYLPNESLELPALPHDENDITPDKTAAGGGVAAAATASGGGACSPSSPALTLALTPHSEEDSDLEVPASNTAPVSQCSLASDECYSETGSARGEGEGEALSAAAAGTPSEFSRCHEDSSNDDLNVSTDCSVGDDDGPNRRRESEGESQDGGGDTKGASAEAGVDKQGEHTREGCTNITAVEGQIYLLVMKCELVRWLYAKVLLAFESFFSTSTSGLVQSSSYFGRTALWLFARTAVYCSRTGSWFVVSGVCLRSGLSHAEVCKSWLANYVQY